MRVKVKYSLLFLTTLMLLSFVGISGLCGDEPDVKGVWQEYINAFDSMLKYVREEIADESVFKIDITPAIIIRTTDPFAVPLVSQTSVKFHICDDYSGFGSGMAVREDGLVLTAGHMVNMDERYKACLSAYLGTNAQRALETGEIAQESYSMGQAYRLKNAYGEEFSAVPVALDKENDLALLKITKDDVALTPVRFSHKTVFSDNPVAIIGHPRGMTEIIVLGKIARQALDEVSGQIIISASLYPGNSGGPVIDLVDMTVVGMVSQVKLFPEPLQIMDLATMVPPWKIRVFLENAFAKIDSAETE